MKIRYMGAHAKKKEKEKTLTESSLEKKSLNLLVLYTEASSLNR